MVTNFVHLLHTLLQTGITWDGDDDDADNDDGDDDDDDEEVVANFVQLLLCHKECRDQIRAGYIQMAAQRILTLR